MGYERSKSVDSFYVHGFQYWDGPFALGRLSVGERVDLVPEPDNPYDTDAVAIYSQGEKLGFVPRAKNFLLATLLAFGHEDVFEAVVSGVRPDVEPWEQVRVTIRVRDNRNGKASR